ncbi:MAG: NUDIX hydrolase [bacterium]|nr:NUDIX hydrolase [bacterium]
MEQKQQIGVGVIVMREGKVLLGKRKGALGSGTWSSPGGHLEWNESVEDCARREVAEETGLTELTDFRFGPYTRDVFEKEARQYITLFVVAHSNSGNPSVLEPDRCDGWQWFAWDKLPSPLFLPVKNLLKLGFSPF